MVSVVKDFTRVVPRDLYLMVGMGLERRSLTLSQN